MVYDTSNNDGGIGMTDSVSHTLLRGYIPFVRMYFGPVPVDLTSVKNVSIIKSASPAYPDPANETINIPFVVSDNAGVTVSLSNVSGQVAGSLRLQAKANRNSIATFATSELPSGVYRYSINTNGQQTKGKFVVAH
jgi:Secretion system C-terminal sorting domain